MKYTLRIIFISAIFFITTFNCEAQFYFRAGYNLGFAKPREINKVIYIHNQINSNYYNVSGNELNEIKNFGGIHIATGSEFGENSGWEMSWSNKHHVSKSEFLFQSQKVNRYLKVRTNNFGLGFYGGGENIAVGGSLDFGNFKGFYKRTDDTSKNAKYVSVFQNQGDFFGYSDNADHDLLRTMQVGFTPFIQFKAGPVGLRVFYQWQFMRLTIDNIDNKLLGGDIEAYNELHDKMSNFGVLFFLQLGGYK